MFMLLDYVICRNVSVINMRRLTYCSKIYIGNIIVITFFKKSIVLYVTGSIFELAVRTTGNRFFFFTS